MRRPLVVVLGTILALTGCASSGPGSPAPAGSSGTGITGSLTVFAAASLTESFNQIGKDFETANPWTKVTFNYGGSSTLAQQITSGAPADVFAAASPATMKTVVDAGDAKGDPAVFVKNQLVIAVPKGNPKSISMLADLAKPGTKVALCAEQVPCGAAAVKALAAGNVQVTPVTLEQDVKAALTKVKLGEVDAALVYRTDAAAAPNDVDAIEFPESAQAINDYPIVVLAASQNMPAAEAFVAYVRGPAGMAVLTKAGFQNP